MNYTITDSLMNIMFTQSSFYLSLIFHGGQVPMKWLIPFLPQFTSRTIIECNHFYVWFNLKSNKNSINMRDACNWFISKKLIRIIRFSIFLFNTTSSLFFFFKKKIYFSIFFQINYEKQIINYKSWIFFF